MMGTMRGFSRAITDSYGRKSQDPPILETSRSCIEVYLLMKYVLLPLGCQMNLSDAERIRTVIEQLGYTPTDNEEEADLLGIVACSVRQKSIDRVYGKIHAWNERKRSRNILTFVSGCVLAEDREKFLTRFDLVFTINELPQLPRMIAHYGVVTPLATRALIPPSLQLPSPANETEDERSSDIRRGFWHVEPTYTSPFEAFVPIQNGCDKFCTFCAVPYTRGREVSRPSREITAEVTRLVEAGYKSITLLGQNVNSYGLDRRSNEISFAELLREVGEITSGHEVWVYFTSPHPRDMTDDVLEAIRDYPTLANQIHLPIQSGDDTVLTRMNRNYRLSGYRRVVESVRRILPEATLFTDIIVGFSGESEQQFERTRAAMREFSYQMAYIALYSPRPGAVSSRWSDDVAQEEKKRRLHELSQELLVSGERYTAALVGRKVRVLVDGIDRQGYLSAKTEGKIPVRIDGTERELIGQFVEIIVTDHRPLSLFGRPANTAAEHRA